MVEYAEAYIVVALMVRIFRSVQPSNDLTGAGLLETEHIVHVVQEQEALTLKFLVSDILLNKKKLLVVFRTLCPCEASLIEASCIVASCLGIAYLDLLLNFLFLAVLINDFFFDFFDLDAVFELPVKILAKTFYKALSVTLEVIIKACICCCPGKISLMKNAVRCKYTSERRGAENELSSVG